MPGRLDAPDRSGLRRRPRGAGSLQPDDRVRRRLHQQHLARHRQFRCHPGPALYAGQQAPAGRSGQSGNQRPRLRRGGWQCLGHRRCHRPGQSRADAGPGPGADLDPGRHHLSAVGQLPVRQPSYLREPRRRRTQRHDQGQLSLQRQRDGLRLLRARLQVVRVQHGPGADRHHSCVVAAVPVGNRRQL
ncbi:hypothetical protein D3C87_1390490 [compost metagenome]